MKSKLRHSLVRRFVDAFQSRLRVRAKSPAWALQYQRYAEVVIDAFCIVDREGRLLEFNPALEALTGIRYTKLRRNPKFTDLVQFHAVHGECPLARALQSGEPVRVDAAKANTSRRSDSRLTIKAVPLRETSDTGEEKVVGALITVRDETNDILLQHKYAELKKEVMIDGLTRIPNRVHLDLELNRRIKSASRDGRPMSAVLIDIDHFKEVNDLYGHQAGDQALIVVADLIRQEARESDSLARFGGEEFMVLLDADASGAAIFAERVRHRLEHHVFSFAGKEIPLRVSIGVSTLQLNWEEGTSVEQIVTRLVKEADIALYLAKNQGRNRIAHFGASASDGQLEETCEVDLSTIQAAS